MILFVKLHPFFLYFHLKNTQAKTVSSYMGVIQAFRKQNKTKNRQTKKSKQDPNSVLIWISNQGL